MNNKVDLTDDELSVIQTALAITIASHERYITINGMKGLTLQDLEAIKEMQVLYDRLRKEYF
jgi:hypothetical protein